MNSLYDGLPSLRYSAMLFSVKKPKFASKRLVFRYSFSASPASKSSSSSFSSPLHRHLSAVNAGAFRCSF